VYLLSLTEKTIHMSVNEVKLQKAAESFVVRGTGPATSRTFCIGDEDHTLGNALRHVLISNVSVGFAGYSVPHPAEPVVQIRVQTVPPSKGEPAPTAIEALKTSCQTLMDQCDIVLEKLEDLMPEVREDRLRMESKLLEGFADDDDEEMEEGDAMDVKLEG
jgi:DNA-directed RNA polymerases I and III subunit RPAC2